MRAVRLAHGLTLDELASRVGVSAGHLSRVERGEKDPSVALLKRCAAALGLRDLDRLLSAFGTDL
jgi:transcriptional regulator with XRE-family HTH domain